MRPWPLKKRETFFPWSASLAIASAATGRADLRVFFIQSDLLLRRLPQRDQAQIFAVFILADLKDHRIQSASYPTNRNVLLRSVGTLVEPVGPREQFLRFLEA